MLNGCVDSIRVLINGTPDFVREQTLKTLTEMLSGGGFILSPSHDYLLEETPVENALAFYDTGFQYRAAISG
ncbi:MAG: uroporphyrinogen decarboxylase family protein [Ruthenibacterium sp.]